MAITAAEKNRRKRERKKVDKRQRLVEADPVVEHRERSDTGLPVGNELKGTSEIGASSKTVQGEENVIIEYVAEPLMALKELGVGGTLELQAKKRIETADTSLMNTGVKDNKNEESTLSQNDNDIKLVMQRFAARASVGVVSDDEEAKGDQDGQRGSDSLNKDDEGERFYDSDDNSYDDNGESSNELLFSNLSRRKLRELIRPTIAELKHRVRHPELVEAHDVTSPDPDFLLYLKSLPNTVPVPRHWGRKRKYLQGKRGIEKPPFQLPHFLAQTGVGDVRSAQAAQEDKMSLKQKQRNRVQVRGGVDVDYKTLHDAFFKFQTKPTNMTGFGDLYYEGKEFELAYTRSNVKPGKLSTRLREALGMSSEKSPPPWLVNMQRYGPPPSYANLAIPGVNAPLPEGCQYGYHLHGWGKPPVDAYGRGLYGDVFGTPNDSNNLWEDGWDTKGPDEVTGDGKRISRAFWGSLPEAKLEEEEEEESSSEDEAEESSQDEEEVEEGQLSKNGAGVQSILPPPPLVDGMESVGPSSGVDLRKTTRGEETPLPLQQQKQLYQVLESQQASRSQQSGALFQSETTYVLPGAAPGTGDAGVESVLSKAPMSQSASAGERKRKQDGGDDDENDELSKKFKF